jgi:hypothetical protein
LSRQKRGTVLVGRKEGQSLKEEKRDGPGRRKRGTVLEEEKRDGPWRKRKRGTVLEEKERQILKN